MSSLSSSFHCLGDNWDVTALENLIEESLTSQENRFRNRIDFVNDIMNNKLRYKGEHCLIYHLKNGKRVLLIS